MRKGAKGAPTKAQMSAAKKGQRDGQRKVEPKVGTGKKPKGSGRRLYTDES